ncbi:Arm DNA-binding domain-containing protein [Streptosporangium sp. KLBMP 9127]|nr:Arm DNA-binding domain-containing protein [Streptosporangium sp. KLBMP 9127]
MTRTLVASPGPADDGKKARKTPKVRDGVVKRGKTWSYVIRVKDTETGESKPRWVGGFATEDDAKAACDEARVKARRGEYVDRNTITVGEYLDDWIEGHAMEIKPRTLSDYRSCIRLYVKPRLGSVRLQAVRPSMITKLYRDLLTTGGRTGKGLGSQDRDPLTRHSPQSLPRCRGDRSNPRLQPRRTRQAPPYRARRTGNHLDHSSTPDLPQGR